MANAGGAWDNAKKIVEVELQAKGTPLHAATVVGDTVGDPFKDTSSVALNPIIKFTTLFGLLAVSLAVNLARESGPGVGARAVGRLLRAVDVFVGGRSTGCGLDRRGPETMEARHDGRRGHWTPRPWTAESAVDILAVAGGRGGPSVELRCLTRSKTSVDTNFFV